MTKTKKRIQKFKETGKTRYNYWNEVEKAYFPFVIAYGSLKELPRTASDRVLRVKEFAIFSNPKCDGCQRRLASVVYKVLPQRYYHKETGIFSDDQQLASELQSPITITLERPKVHLSY